MVFKKETYSNQVAEFIRKMIRDGELLPGVPVKEANLAERLGISRAPIREALQELNYEGLVTSEPQKGKHVRKMSPKDILDSYVVGGILESCGVADSLEMWSEEDMTELRKIVSTMQSRSDHAVGVEDLMELDDRFHDTLLQHCDNSRLVEMARLSCVTLSKVLFYHQWLNLYTPHEFFERHAAIANAIYAKDTAKVAQMLRAHYQEVGERMAQYGMQE